MTRFSRIALGLYLCGLIALVRADDDGGAPTVQRGAMIISSTHKGVVYQMSYDAYAAVEAFAQTIQAGGAPGDDNTQSAQETAQMFENTVKSGKW